MNSTFQNTGQVLSIGVFFTLMIVGLSVTLPADLVRGLVDQGIPAVVAHRAAGLPPVSTLFASFLGYNPMEHLLGSQVIASLPESTQATILGREFFPTIISNAFRNGLHAACDAAVLFCLLAAGTSWMRGGKYVYVEPEHTSVSR